MKKIFSRHFWFIFLFFALLLIAGFALFLSKKVDLNNQSRVNSSNRSSPLKIFTTEEGIYEVSGSDLENAGLSVSDSRDLKLSLFNEGGEVPLWGEGEGKNLKLHFFARPSQSLYTSENIYWLVPGNGLGNVENQIWEVKSNRVISPTQMDGPVLSVQTPAGGDLSVVKMEQNLVYFPQVEAGDHWLWTNLAAPKSHSFEVDLPDLLPGSAGLQVKVWASTEAELNPDHHLVISINGSQVADEKWDGKGEHIIGAAVPEGILKAGKNTLTIDAPGDTGVGADIAFLDWFEIEYPHRLVADNDRLFFTCHETPLRLEGFSAPYNLYDVTDPSNAMEVENPSTTEFNCKKGHHYWAVSAAGYRRPVRVSRSENTPDLRSKDQGADYVAIGPVDLLEPLKPLLSWRETQGLKVATVPLEAIYDQFNSGFPEPDAIREFLKYASTNWKPVPRFVLLVGDASYDPKGFQAPPEANRLPTFMVNTAFGGETASDLGFVQIGGDELPEMAIGRIPARTADQVGVLVKKTLDFEKLQIDSEWKNRLLAISDGQDASFKSDAQDFLNLFPDSYQKGLLAPEAGNIDVSQQILEQLNQGERLVAYFGHGSLNMWGKDRLFTADDVSRLKNGDRLPVIVNMTCLTGLFTHPKQDSLAESFLWKPDGGAVAVLAPTSLTLPSEQSFLSRSLVQVMLENPNMTLGEALTEARRRAILDSKGAGDVIRTFLLFGDPALRLTK